MVTMMADAPSTRFAEIIQGVIATRGVSARQIAAYADVAPTSVTMWLRGAVVPRPDTLRKLAEKLRLDYNELMVAAGHLSASDVTPAVADPSPSVSTIRLAPEQAAQRLAELAMAGGVRQVIVQRTWAHAGAGAEESQVVWVPPQIAARNIAAFEVTGNCMEPAVTPGDIVIVDLDGSPRDGNMVVVHIGGRVLIRTFDARAGALIATNGEPPIRFEDAEDIAPVRGMYKSL